MQATAPSITAPVLETAGALTSVTTATKAASDALKAHQAVIEEITALERQRNALMQQKVAKNSAKPLDQQLIPTIAPTSSMASAIASLVSGAVAVKDVVNKIATSLAVSRPPTAAPLSNANLAQVLNSTTKTVNSTTHFGNIQINVPASAANSPSQTAEAVKNGLMQAVREMQGNMAGEFNK